jgi:phytanoyl-CoA hydroxylase
MDIEVIKKLKKDYHENGYTIVRGLVSKAHINDAKEDLNKEISKLVKNKKLRSRDINYTNDQINSIHSMGGWSWTKKLQKNKKLIKIVSHLIKGKLENYGAELFAKPANVGLPAPLHQDNYFWCLKNNEALTVWIALDKANDKNGGVFYFKKSHKLGLLEHAQSFAPGTSQKIKYPDGLNIFKKYSPSLNPGDCIIHNSYVVHGSDKNISNSPRVGWTLRFKAKDNKIDPMRKKQYEKELVFQIKMRKKSARI